MVAVNRFVIQNAKTPAQRRRVLDLMNSTRQINQALSFEGSRFDAKKLEEAIANSLCAAGISRVDVHFVEKLSSGGSAVWVCPKNADKTQDVHHAMEACGFVSVSVSHFVLAPHMIANGFSF